MRNFFLILLLANLLLLAWLFWVDPEPPVAMQATGANELAIYGQPSSRAAAGSDSGDESTHCIYIGPVSDLDAAQQLAGALAKRGVEARPVTREGRVWLGHWVQIQGFADKEVAETARRRLLGAGLPDAYVMQDGPVTIISLGVFREQGRAERVIEAARQAGFTAVMKERVRAAAEYWLVSALANGQPAALKDLAVGYDRILRAETAPCPAGLNSMPGTVEPE